MLTAAAGGAGAAALTMGLRPTRTSAAPPSQRGLNHLAWVWVFEDDGAPDVIRPTLARNGLGIILKTHDGTDWMGRWDQSRTAIHGPEHVRGWANFFEAMGVPFHAWAVVEGLDPIAEARMAAEVLSSGARSLTIDLEPKENRNYWQAGREEAMAFGRELRRLQPTAWISVAPDPRPWQLDAVPMAEFASFTNEVAPQTYWETFNSSANYRLLRDRGVEVGPDGVTPELILDVTQAALQRFRLPVRPVGQGNSNRDSWSRFVGHAFRLGMDTVSVWRYGTANSDLWPLLQQMRPDAQTVAVPQRSTAYYSIPSATGDTTFAAPQTPAQTLPDTAPAPQSPGATATPQTTTTPQSTATPRPIATEVPGGKQPWRWRSGW